MRLHSCSTSLSDDNPGVRRGGNVMGDCGGRAKKSGLDVAGAARLGDATEGTNRGGGGEESEDGIS